MLIDCFTQSSFFEGLSINVSVLESNLLNLFIVVPGVLTWLFALRKIEFVINDFQVLSPFTIVTSSLETTRRLAVLLYSKESQDTRKAMAINFENHYKDGVTVTLQNLKLLLDSLKITKVNHKHRYWSRAAFKAAQYYDYDKLQR